MITNGLMLNMIVYMRAYACARARACEKVRVWHNHVGNVGKYFVNKLLEMLSKCSISEKKHGWNRDIVKGVWSKTVCPIYSWWYAYLKICWQYYLIF